MPFWTGPVMRRLRPGIAATLDRSGPYAQAWAEASERALTEHGPLWVALGDSTAQGIGADAFDDGYVGQLRERLEARDAERWRVVNLSRTGARIADVLAEQMPRLAELVSTAALVTCAVGANDLLRLRFAPVPGDVHRLIAALPPGAILATLPQGLWRWRARRANEIIWREAPAAGLVVADVWARTGPPWRGKYAADGFHPNEVGYRHWADAFSEVLGLGSGA